MMLVLGCERRTIILYDDVPGGAWPNSTCTTVTNSCPKDRIEQRRKEGLDNAAIKKELIERFKNALVWEARSPSEPEAPKPAWPVRREDAYCGLAGEIVNTIKPESEADPVAILIQVLVAAGNVFASPQTGSKRYPASTRQL